MHYGSDCSLLINLIIESKNSSTQTMSIHILYLVNNFVQSYVRTYLWPCRNTFITFTYVLMLLHVHNPYIPEQRHIVAESHT